MNQVIMSMIYQPSGMLLQIENTLSKIWYHRAEEARYKSNKERERLQLHLNERTRTNQMTKRAADVIPQYVPSTYFMSLRPFHT